MIIRPAGRIASIADEELAARKAYERTLELRTRVFDINYASVSVLKYLTRVGASLCYVT